MDSKDKSETQPTRNHDIKCFRYLKVRHIDSQCPNKRLMILKDHSEIEFESERSKDDEMPPLKDFNKEVAYPIKRETSNIRYTLHVRVNKDDM